MANSAFEQPAGLAAAAQRGRHRGSPAGDGLRPLAPCTYPQSHIVVPGRTNERAEALTAHAMAGERGQALAAGCDDFDIKPIDLDRLLGKIEALLGGEAKA